MSSGKSHEGGKESPDQLVSDSQTLLTHVRQRMGEKVIECALLDRHVSGTSKYRTLGSVELKALLPSDLSSALT
ncbi:MAG: hypothetical protein IPK92_14610 [Nitrospira sp.]|nr:hypothetical protein [Nitrospira sp.]